MSNVTLPPTVSDLFCGAGGLTLGLAKAGFRAAYSADSWEAAVSTFRRNLHEADATELREDSSLPKTDVIVGGPPCQGFSSAGCRRPDDPRNSLVSVFARMVARHLPTAFIFENVEGFLTAAEGRRVFDLLDPLVNAGYRIHLRKVNAANYGVPQHRKRIVAIGGLGWDPSFPEPTHVAEGVPGSMRTASQGLPRAPTVRAALDGLPPASPTPPGNPTDHFAKPLEGVDMERAIALAPGMTMKDLPEGLRHPSYQRRAFRRVMDGTPTECRGGAPAGIRRLLPDQPSKAITSGATTEFLHPFEQRTLTLRECARLQTFPDDFVFQGSKADRALLIGNAVPPRLAEALGRTLLIDLQSKTDRQSPGALLSFVPTASEGTSPALARLIAAVGERFAPYQTQLSLIR